jgi:hypothetical protein
LVFWFSMGFVFCICFIIHYCLEWKSEKNNTNSL